MTTQTREGRFSDVTARHVPSQWSGGPSRLGDVSVQTPSTDAGRVIRTRTAFPIPSLVCMKTILPLMVCCGGLLLILSGCRSDPEVEVEVEAATRNARIALEELGEPLKAREAAARNEVNARNVWEAAWRKVRIAQIALEELGEPLPPEMWTDDVLDAWVLNRVKARKAELKERIEAMESVDLLEWEAEKAREVWKTWEVAYEREQAALASLRMRRKFIPVDDDAVDDAVRDRVRTRKAELRTRIYAAEELGAWEAADGNRSPG